MLKDLALFNKMVEFLLEEEKKNPVAKPIATKDLFDTLDLDLKDEPAVEVEFVDTLRKVVQATPKTASKMFFNQLFGGRQSRAVLGDLLAVMLNNSMYTYKVAGPQVGIEKAIIHKVCEHLGYDQQADGVLAAGGSMSNLMAVLMARDRIDPEIRTKGMIRPMIMYTSAASHYSLAKNAALMGLGRNQVRKIPVDQEGRMIEEALEKQIESDKSEGYMPFFVNATAGTTVLGAFDRINPIADICEKHGLWLHIDGAYCGSVIFSKKYAHLVSGANRSDSFSVNGHKMLGTPLSCSIIVTRHPDSLHDSFSNDASYLYQTSGDEYNLGKISLQCGRRNDALKLWTLWKSIGTSGIEAMVDHEFDLADIARNYIRKNPDYTLYSFDDSISVCFNYKNVSAENLCTALYEESEIMVGYGSFQGNQFVRLVTINAANSEEDILNFFKTIEAFVEAHSNLLGTAIESQIVSS